MMRRRSIALRLGALLITAAFFANSHLAVAAPLLNDARMALDENIPEVAIFKLRRCLADADFPPAEIDAASLLLSRALLADGEREEALQIAMKLAAKGDSDAQLLKATILAAGGEWEKALAGYKTLVAKTGSPEATMGAAECFQALDKRDEAAELLAPLVRNDQGGVTARLRLAALQVDLRQLTRAREILRSTKPGAPEEKKWKDYVDGRLLLAQGEPYPAMVLFDEILESREHLSDSLLFAATFGEAAARAELFSHAEARRVLERFIQTYPESAHLDQAFRRLDEYYAEDLSSPEGELHRWSGVWAGEATPREEARRAAFALFYVGKMQVRRHDFAKAEQSLEAFVHRYPTHPLLAQAYLLQAEVYTGDPNSSRSAEAIRVLDAALRLAGDGPLRPEIEMQEALIHYQQGDEVMAAEIFEGVARHSARLRQVATFDAEMAWLHQKNFELFHKGYAVFSAAAAPGNPLRAELALEEGLVRARAHDKDARSFLESFLEFYPGHRREGEAKLALAELSFLDAQDGANPHALNDAAVYLQAANVAAADDPETSVHAEYLAIFLADAQQPPHDEKVISLARKFLQAHGDAGLGAEVQMKLGQVYFRREDFANAETAFAQLAEQQDRLTPPGAYAETALFLAGQSAMKLINIGAVDRAFRSFERVVQRNGPLKLYAQQQEAILQSKTGRESDAIVLYESIFAAPGADLDLRQAALCGKAENLRALGAKDSKSLEAAVAAFAQLASLPDVSAHWRNQALYEEGKSLEQLGRVDEALNAYYDALQQTSAHGDQEYFWYYKAGFDAARIFEEKAEWKSAIGIYDKMIKLGGPRAEEAQKRVRELRLKNFIWE